MPTRYWPLDRGCKITSPFGPRTGGFHAGIDFGWDGGSAGKAVYAVQAGTVIMAGPAQGYGGGEPGAGWLVIDSDDSQGSGVFEYGHIIAEVGVGARVQAGQRIAHINPNRATNGGVDPHCHVSYMPYAYNPNTKQDWRGLLNGALYPGDTPPRPPAPSGITGDTLAEAWGRRAGVDYGGLAATCNAAMIQCGADTVNKAAMFLAQLGHESGGGYWREEIASGAAYEWRQDLGNTQPGDGVRFKGRSFIQITGRHNYTQLSRWAHARGLVPSPTFFVDNPPALASNEYVWLGAVWYFTEARPQFMAAADRGDLEACTRMVNGGLNGLDDRRNYFNRARALGARILPANDPGGFLMALTKEQQDRIYYELTNEFQSLFVDENGVQSEFRGTLGRYIQLVDAKTEAMRVRDAARDAEIARQGRVLDALAKAAGVKVQ